MSRSTSIGVLGQPRQMYMTSNGIMSRSNSVAGSLAGSFRVPGSVQPEVAATSGLSFRDRLVALAAEQESVRVGLTRANPGASSTTSLQNTWTPRTASLQSAVGMAGTGSIRSAAGMTGTGSIRTSAGIMPGTGSLRSVLMPGNGSIRSAAGITTGSIRVNAAPMTPTSVPRIDLSSLPDHAMTMPGAYAERQGTPIRPDVVRQITPSVACSLGEMVVPLPVPASKYIPDNTDAMDMALSVALWMLDAESVATLWLRRVSRGVYEIDRRRVSVSWRDQEQNELLVLEDEVPGSEAMPMLDYLRQVASITLSLAATKKAATTPERANSAAAPVFYSSGDPVATVADDGASYEYTGDSPEGNDDKITSMILACEEAGVPSAEADPYGRSI